MHMCCLYVPRLQSSIRYQDDIYIFIKLGTKSTSMTFTSLLNWGPLRSSGTTTDKKWSYYQNTIFHVRFNSLATGETIRPSARKDQRAPLDCVHLPPSPCSLRPLVPSNLSQGFLRTLPFTYVPACNDHIPLHLAYPNKHLLHCSLLETTSHTSP